MVVCVIGGRSAMFAVLHNRVGIVVLGNVGEPTSNHTSTPFSPFSYNLVMVNLCLNNSFFERRSIGGQSLQRVLQRSLKVEVVKVFIAEIMINVVSKNKCASAMKRGVKASAVKKIIKVSKDGGNKKRTRNKDAPHSKRKLKRGIKMIKKQGFILPKDPGAITPELCSRCKIGGKSAKNIKGTEE